MDNELLGLIVKELNKNGVNLIKHDFSNIDTFSPENVDYCYGMTGGLPQIFDFTEHDKRFEYEISDLRKKLRESKDYITQLKHDLETKDNIQKINLNETIKVKLTPYGAEIYYKQFDELNKQCGREICKPHMPQIDKDGYTEFQLWNFIELYGQHIGMCKPNVIEPLDVVYCGSGKYHSDHAE